ncbi:MAG: hypothetical protein IID44_10100 [Planctomycetes bacterium]|nr:hypothetical protein [Planctomycetota bacterium]
MALTETPFRIMEEIADLFASSPSRDELLAFRPSPAVQQRATDLLDRQADGAATPEDQRELDQFAQAELLMRLVKSRLRTPAAS